MEDFVTTLVAAEQASIDSMYRMQIEELRWKKEAMEEMKNQYDLTLLPVVPLPEFEVRELTFKSAVTDVRRAGEGTIAVYFGNTIVTVELATGNILSTFSFNSHGSHYEGKNVTYDCEEYEETEEEIRIPQKNFIRSTFLARNAKGEVTTYRNDDYLLSQGEVFRVDSVLWMGTHCVKTLCHEISGRMIALFVYRGIQKLFRYRGEWYQYNQASDGGEIRHCRSCVELPCPFPRRKELYVQGDYIVLRENINYTRNLQILTPRPAAE